MNLRCTSCAHSCCDQKKCSCACHKKSFHRTNQILSNVMGVVGKPIVKPVKNMNFTWHTNILGSMMRLE